MKPIVLKEKISEYTEDEIISLLNEFRKSTRQAKALKGKDLEKYLDELLDNFILISGHPKKGDLIAYPSTPEDGDPVRILSIVKEWRKSQGLPLFKDSE